MNFLISGYHSHVRLACIQRQVVQHTKNYSFPSDDLIITKDSLSFQSDNYILNPKKNPKLFQLQVGDILLIAENGVASLIYSNSEKEATVFLTGHCNSNCLMCPMTENERTRQDKTILKKISFYNILTCFQKKSTILWLQEESLPYVKIFF